MFADDVSRDNSQSNIARIGQRLFATSRHPVLTEIDAGIDLSVPKSISNVATHRHFLIYAAIIITVIDNV